MRGHQELEIVNVYGLAVAISSVRTSGELMRHPLTRCFCYRQCAFEDSEARISNRQASETQGLRGLRSETKVVMVAAEEEAEA